MNWNDLEELWREQTAPGASTPPDERAKVALIGGFEKRSRTLSRKLFWREWREILACLFVAVYWVHKWWEIGSAGWPLLISLGLALWLIGYLLGELCRRRKMKLPAQASLSAKVAGDLAELRRQRRLLKSVGVWYVGPLALGVLVDWIVGMRLGTRPTSLGVLVTDVWVFGAIAWGVWWLNQRAVRKKIEPEIAELERLEGQLGEAVGTRKTGEGFSEEER